MFAAKERRNKPGLAQLEEHETVMGNQANLRVACSSQAHRILFFLPPVKANAYVTRNVVTKQRGHGAKLWCALVDWFWVRSRC